MKNPAYTLLILFFIACDLIYFTAYDTPKGHPFEEYSHQVCGEVVRGVQEIHSTGGRRSTARTEYWLSLNTESGQQTVEVDRQTWLTTNEGQSICQNIYKPINFIIKIAVLFQLIFIAAFGIGLIGSLFGKYSNTPCK